MATYTKKEIAKVLDSTGRTITADSDFLIAQGYIKPTRGDGKPNEYSESDLEIFRQLRNHCQENNNRKTFVPQRKVEIVTQENIKSELAFSKQKISAVEKFSQIFQSFSATDPFYDYVQLQRAADNSWYLPTDILSVIIRKHPKTFRHLQRFSFKGFIIDRQPEKEGNTYIWSINANQ